MIIGYDAKRIVRNGTGLGSYGRTLVNDIARVNPSLRLNLYAPDKGRDELREQIITAPGLTFCYPKDCHQPLDKALWRSRGIVKDLKNDGVQLYHGLSGELPWGIRKSGIHSIVTIHDLIFLRHPEFYNWIDTKIYAWKFRQTIRETDRRNTGGISREDDDVWRKNILFASGKNVAGSLIQCIPFLS